jgi:thioesterase domain-containing protein
LFLVHAIDGFVFFYRDLANALDAGRPVYAFQAQGLEQGSKPLPCIEDMAELYLQAMRNIHPEGPYLLGGVSMGGAVAFEMAQQLHAAGEETKLLFLSDTPPTNYMMFNLEDDTAVLRFAVKHLLKLDDSVVDWDSLRGQAVETQVDRVLEQTSDQNDSLFTLSADVLTRMILVIDIHQQALRTYQPQPYPGRMIFFRPAEVIGNAQLGLAEQFWLKFAQGGMEINNVPGDHLSMNFEPHVLSMADELRRHF